MFFKHPVCLHPPHWWVDPFGLAGCLLPPEEVVVAHEVSVGVVVLWAEKEPVEGVEAPPGRELAAVAGAQVPPGGSMSCYRMTQQDGTTRWHNRTAQQDGTTGFSHKNMAHPVQLHFRPKTVGQENILKGETIIWNAKYCIMLYLLVEGN